MLDNDLAALYQVETKYLNRAAKRCELSCSGLTVADAVDPTVPLGSEESLAALA